MIEWLMALLHSLYFSVGIEDWPSEFNYIAEPGQNACILGDYQD